MGIAPSIGGRGGNARAEIQTTAQGLVAQNFDRAAAANTFTLVGGTAYAMLIGLKAGDVITNGYVEITTVGTGTTLFKLGIYSKDGATKYAATADKSASFGSLGCPALALASPWTVPADDVYYVVIVATASTTLPTLARGMGSNVTKIGSNYAPQATGGTGLSDLPATTVTYSSSGSVGIWVGLG